MSNAFRLCSFDHILVTRRQLNADDPLYNIAKSIEKSNLIEAITSSDWKLANDALYFPVQSGLGVELWCFTISSTRESEAMKFPEKGHLDRDLALHALNGALQVDVRRRALESHVPFISIDFFAIEGDPDELGAYVNIGSDSSRSDPTSCLGTASYSMAGPLANLSRQSSSLLLQSNWGSSTGSISAASTPLALAQSCAISRSVSSPAGIQKPDSKPHSSSEYASGTTPTSSPLVISRKRSRRHANARSPGASNFVVEPHPLSKHGLITLPEVISVRIPKHMARYVPPRILYEAVRTQSESDEKPDEEEVTETASNAADGGQPEEHDDEYYMTDTSSDSDHGSVVSVHREMRPASDPGLSNNERTVTAQVLVLIQQHVHDPFFCSLLAQTWKRQGSSSVSFPLQMPELSSSSSRLRKLLLASTILPSWRAVTSALPIQQTKAEQSMQSFTSLSLDQIVVDDCDLLLGFDGDIRTISLSSVEFWEEACLEPFKSKADVSFVVIPPPTSTAADKGMLIEPFMESLSVMYETSMLGHHSPIKCFDEVLSLPMQFQETCKSGDNKADFATQYYSFVVERLSQPSMRSRLSSTDTSVVVIYVILDDTIPVDMLQFASLLNRLRLVLGAPTWTSTSRRKNVVGQIVPYAVVQGLHHISDIPLMSVLRRLVFSVFARSHFVPAIPVDSNGGSRTRELDLGLGLTAFEPAYVVHCDCGIPNPVQAVQRSVLAVHVAYLLVRIGDNHEWIVGCATDMRGERSHTACVRHLPGQPIFDCIASFWMECIRPVLDFLHSRTDQGAMSIIISRIGNLNNAEIESWASLLVHRLGNVWTSFQEADLRPETVTPLPAKEQKGLGVSTTEMRFLVSCAFFVSCPRAASLQSTAEAPPANALLLHRHRMLSEDRRDPPPIVNANLYCREGISLHMSLERFLVHAPVKTIQPGFVLDAFRAVVQQTLALNAFSDIPGTGLPLHFATTQRLALSLTAVLQRLKEPGFP